MLDEIDRVLTHEEEIIPSSGFAASVMEAVRREASTPPPIPFPWLRALPGIVVAGIVLIMVVVELVIQTVKAFSAPQVSTAWPGWLAPLFHAHILNSQTAAAGMWLALALLVSLGSVMFSMRLTSART